MQNTVQFAIEEAARSAIVDSTTTAADVETMATDTAADLDATDLTFDVTFEDESGARAYINVTGTYAFAPFVPIVVPFIGSDNSIDLAALDYHITASTCMPVVQ